MPDLARFVAAQDPVIGAVQAELQAGRKRTHWMWFIFPQLRGLGHSPTARHYGIADRAEAAAYLAHPILGPRLLDCTNLVLTGPEADPHRLFGTPDDLKFRSCLTLFDALGTTDRFGAALARFYGGERDALTIGLLN